MSGKDMAFPFDYTSNTHQGLTKRELFSAMMLQGILSRGVPVVDPPISGAALMAADYADALIAVLSASK